jgi:diacylglycerol kinase (ATP)
MVKIVLIINGAQKLKNKAKQLIHYCDEHHQIESTVYITKEAKEATTIAYNVAKEYPHAIIAVGGDGTINEVLNGIMKFEGPKPFLGIIPNGTGNDFVRSAKLTLSSDDFISALLTSQTKEIDVLKISTEHLMKYFINIADIGFGGKVVEIMNKQRKFIKGHFAYNLAILTGFLTFKRPIITIKTADFFYTGSVLMAAVCNGSIFASGININSFAKLDDNKINITLFGKLSLFHYLYYLPRILKGKPISHPQVTYLETEYVEIEQDDDNGFAEIDGELLEGKLFKIMILPKAIKLLIY